MARMAAFLLAISGALHVLLPFVGEFVNEAAFHLPVGIVWLAVAYGLSFNLRWLAWLAFFAAMAGAITAMSFALDYPAIPNALFWAIAGLQALAVVVLFGVLWISKRRGGGVTTDRARSPCHSVEHNAFSE